MQKLFILTLALFFAFPVSAGPLDWIKRHPTATAFMAAGGAATFHALALRHCRQGSVENCQAKYGAAWASFGVITGANFTMVAVSSSCRKDGHGKFCNVFAFGGSAAQTGFAVNQWRNKGNAETASASFRSLLRR